MKQFGPVFSKIDRKSRRTQQQFSASHFADKFAYEYVARCFCKVPCVSVGLVNHLQSWTKVLGTVLQYSYFSVISRFPLKRVRLSRNFLAVLPPPTPYKVETRKKFRIHASNIVCGVRGEAGPVGIENAPEKQKCPKTFVHDCSLEFVLHCGKPKFISFPASLLINRSKFQNGLKYI